MTVHELPLERRTLHGHFSRELEPVLRLEPGDSVRFSTIDAGWGMEGGSGREDRPHFEPRDPVLDAGHALVGPIEVAGAKAGQTLSVRIDDLRVGTYGLTPAGGWPSWLNERLGLADGETITLWWELDADAGVARDQHGHEVDLRPFLGVIGMPPPFGDEPFSTTPPRRWGGNLDCSELVVGSTLFLPIPVDGALLSLGDGHARQGDGEVCGTAIECSMVAAQVTVDLDTEREVAAPLVRTPDAWIALGIDEDLDDALADATSCMLELIQRDYGVERHEALALASVAVDFRVTQVVNLVKGVHAILRDDAVRAAT